MLSMSKNKKIKDKKDDFQYLIFSLLFVIDGIVLVIINTNTITQFIGEIFITTGSLFGFLYILKLK